MVANLFCKSRLSPASWISILTIGCSVSISLNPAPVFAARTVSAIYGPLEISASVKEIESFAQTGSAPASLQPILQFLSPKQRSDLRNVLQQKLKVDQQSVLVFGRTEMGRDLLQRLSTVIQTAPDRDGKVLLFKGIAYANQEPQGLTVLNLFRNYPVDTLRLNVGPLLQAQSELTALLKYRDTSVRAIEHQMLAEIAAAPSTDFAQLPDYRQLGSASIIYKKLDLSSDPSSSDSTLPSSSSYSRPLEVDFYLPQQSSQPSPVVIISHGLGTAPSNYRYLAQHLASYGFAVVLPQHVGSDATHLESVLEGQALDDVNPTEFANRPLDIKHLLNSLTQLAVVNPSLAAQLDLKRVGIIGHSFGAYTSLAVAGAKVDPTRLQEQCEGSQPTFNLSLILQCRARAMPPTAETLSDSRIKAVIAVNPFASTVFGPRGIGSIQIPTMVVSSSNDILTPAISEQIHPFLWLKTPKKYLALLNNAGHSFPTDSPNAQSTSDAQKGLRSLLAGADPQLAQSYLQALSTAFMKTHLSQQPDAEQYLSAAYAQYLSQAPVKLDLIQSLTPAQLEQAYGGPLPLPKLLPVGDADHEKTSMQRGVDFFASPQRWFEYYAERFLVSLKKELGRLSFLS